MLEKPRYVTLSYKFLSRALNTCVYLRVSFSAADIIKLKEEEIFNPKILMMETTNFDEQKPFSTSLSKNRQHLPCTETGTVKPPRQVRKSPSWLLKDLFSLVKALERVVVGGKIVVFQFQKDIFFWANYFLEKFLLYNTISVWFVWIGLKLALFYYANSPSFYEWNEAD